MQAPRKLLIAFGTRPEAVKMAPIVIAMKSAGVEVETFFSGQHKDLVRPIVDYFGVALDHEGELVRNTNDFADIVPQIMLECNRVLGISRPDFVLVQGDTSTALACALSAFYLRVPVGHVEAGLRTFRADEPFPEEINRQLIARIAAVHFAPTAANRLNLLSEGINADDIVITGNTGLDALRLVCERLDDAGLPQIAAKDAEENRATILATVHRRENFGARIEEIFEAIRDLAQAEPALRVVLATHPNPLALEPARRIFASSPNVNVSPSLDYPTMVALLRRCSLLITDSGGLQEEAHALDLPTIVVRDQTEREELLNSPLVSVTGAKRSRILAAVKRFGTAPTGVRSFNASNIYGDGRAAERICGALALLPGKLPAHFANYNLETLKEYLPGGE